MIRLGPYTIKRIKYQMFDHDKREIVWVKGELYIRHDDGEAMGCNQEDEQKLVAMLNEFWKREF